MFSIDKENTVERSVKYFIHWPWNKTFSINTKHINQPPFLPQPTRPSETLPHMHIEALLLCSLTNQAKNILKKKNYPKK